MLKILKASFFKLFKDRAFKVTLIIGIVLGLLYGLLYSTIGGGLTGYFVLLSSSSPLSNFGIAVPINLIIFIIGEFNYGTIRNKIIAGNKRSHIFITLLIMGILYSFILMGVYMGISTALSSIIGGFGDVDPAQLWMTIGYTAILYIMLSALSVTTAASIRHTGISVTVTVIILVIGMVAFLISISNSDVNYDMLMALDPIAISFVNLLGGIIGMGSSGDLIRYLGISMVSCVVYTVLFTGLGLFIFLKRDVK